MGHSTQPMDEHPHTGRVEKRKVLSIKNASFVFADMGFGKFNNGALKQGTWRTLQIVYSDFYMIHYYLLGKVDEFKKMRVQKLLKTLMKSEASVTFFKNLNPYNCNSF